jgi:hypothetical protein
MANPVSGGQGLLRRKLTTEPFRPGGKFLILIACID